jgi:hypothetical protein
MLPTIGHSVHGSIRKRVVRIRRDSDPGRVRFRVLSRGSGGQLRSAVDADAEHRGYQSTAEVRAVELGPDHWIFCLPGLAA